jgi:hypothetical protein
LLVIQRIDVREHKPYRICSDFNLGIYSVNVSGTTAGMIHASSTRPTTSYFFD